MRLNNLPSEFQQALPSLKKIQAAGYEAYFVGGCVRDVLLNHPIHDVDIATSAFPEEVKALFPKTFDVGIEHGTVMVLADNQETYEITTFRTESTYQDFRRPDQVAFVRSLKEDLKRRDFTVNALALTVDGEIIDLFAGLKDLEDKVLRAVGNPHERLHEDALRMMRGLRFMSQLGFSLEENTFAAILANHQLLEKISVERVHVEFMKLMLGSYRRDALLAFVETQCYQYCPGLAGGKEALLKIADLPERPLASESQVWALLLSVLQTPLTEINSFLKHWRCSNQVIKEVQQLVLGLKFRLEQPWTLQLIYQLGAEALQNVEELRYYFGQESQVQQVLASYQALPIHDLKDLAITGQDLLTACQAKAGKWVSLLLARCEEAVLLGELPNEKDQLLAFAKKAYPEILANL
ncbi:tRNA nucleotidyltransferase (CCA-adding enzyme) [Enterococcus sp. PF1-24]|uniref:CCA tRNA nucleotidyltransferase n=1 Tax=unclassified Enterococcus TaxID=2608891 RepID=UPI00247461FF|nr:MULTISPECIES: CCA tRNA nucleotidyltransferase [unclassified Enterococcus]MDH6365615.1 tRNA nucleotidyltransferase (CCA-adding enzyme) [Enterococcus sp. PFB1-1]MDH6402717.1 tRNA nucleotidyltransferase (CCA-adding enzyme) [Enterococcus sp. PF1-24]